MSSQLLRFPIEGVSRPEVSPEFYARPKDDVEPIATAYAHDETIRKISESVSAEIWRAKINNRNGTDAMLIRFAEIDLDYDYSNGNSVEQKYTGEILYSEPVSPSLIGEIAVLFDLADDHEAIMKLELKRIEEEKIKRIASAHEFFIRGLVASVPDEENFL
jgi:hypothetical protein